MTSVISLMASDTLCLVQWKVAHVMHGFHIGYATCAVAERTGLDTGRYQRTVRCLGRDEITTILLHVLGSE